MHAQAHHSPEEHIAIAVLRTLRQSNLPISATILRIKQQSCAPAVRTLSFHQDLRIDAEYLPQFFASLSHTLSEGKIFLAHVEYGLPTTLNTIDDLYFYLLDTEGVSTK